VSDEIRIEQGDGYCAGHFSAMASPCLILIEDASRETVHRLTLLARQEARRIEQKFSRYRDDNIIHRLHHSNGQPVEVDAETANLLDYADQCYRLSEGRFDMTSGVLREVWRFDGSDQYPTAEAVAAVLARVGWDKVCWQRPYFTLPAGMEIDLGGIGKEYAVDRTAQLLGQFNNDSLLINYGGDLYASRPRRDGKPWVVALDDPLHTGQRQLGTLQLKQGGMATSGDARRFLLKDGVHYGHHILNPLTGWPVENAPRSITVQASNCMEAGMLATLAMLQGKGANAFLQAQDLPYWIID
jgi:thiamine biosynthesis lipoprotein